MFLVRFLLSLIGISSYVICAGHGEEKAIDPLHQFELITLIPIRLGDVDLSFTNASLWMVIASLVLCVFGYLATNSRHIVPSRLALIFEQIHDFVATMVSNQMGRDGMVYFPYIFSLFLFILVANLLGILPYSFTTTSHISVTFTLAVMVFISTIVIGISKHHWHFSKLFCPSGIPGYIKPILVPIEILSFLARPFVLAIRLFANMVAGHVMIKIFASFINLMPESSVFVLGALPILMNAGLTGFEILVAGLQAYIFTVLTCIYLNDALHLH